MRFAQGAGSASVGRKKACARALPSTRYAACPHFFPDSKQHVFLIRSALDYLPRGEQREGCRRYGFHSRCPLGSTPAELVPRQRMVGIAQLVERCVVVADVAGSNPVTHPERADSFSLKFRAPDARSGDGRFNSLPARARQADDGGVRFESVTSAGRQERSPRARV